jgi:hypothetical protein
VLGNEEGIGLWWDKRGNEAQLYGKGLETLINDYH